MEMFGHLPDDFDLTLVAQDRGAVRSAQKLAAVAEASTGDDTRYDILFVPGGPGTRVVLKDGDLLDWIARTAQQAEYVLSVCTGSALLAKAGVLDGVRATTNKAAFDWVVSQGPDVDWQRQARWVQDGRFFTSSGVSAGMDMTLAVIEHLHGSEQAEDVALVCEYEWHRDAARDPFAQAHGLV
jgi:transcriptional regulator GlxA family with amidase domain